MPTSPQKKTPKEKKKKSKKHQKKKKNRKNQKKKKQNFALKLWSLSRGCPARDLIARGQNSL